MMIDAKVKIYVVRLSLIFEDNYHLFFFFFFACLCTHKNTYCFYMSRFLGAVVSNCYGG
jgi:hypothetical protein